MGKVFRWGKSSIFLLFCILISEILFDCLGFRFVPVVVVFVLCAFVALFTVGFFAGVDDFFFDVVVDVVDCLCDLVDVNFSRFLERFEVVLDECDEVFLFEVVEDAFLGVVFVPADCERFVGIFSYFNHLINPSSCNHLRVSGVGS